MALGSPRPADPSDRGEVGVQDGVVRYLDAYARHPDLPVRLRSEVRRIERSDGARSAVTNNGRIVAEHVVVATGYNRVPWTPVWPGMDSFTGRVVHASENRNPRPFERGATCSWSARGTRVPRSPSIWSRVAQAGSSCRSARHRTSSVGISEGFPARCWASSFVTFRPGSSTRSPRRHAGSPSAICAGTVCLLPREASTRGLARTTSSRSSTSG